MLNLVRKKALFPKDLQEEFAKNNTEYNNVSAMFLAIVFVILSGMALFSGYASSGSGFAKRFNDEFWIAFPFYIIGFVLSLCSIFLLLLMRKRKMSYHWVSDFVTLIQTILFITVFQVTSHIEALKTGNKNVNFIILIMFCVILFVRLRLKYMLILEAGITITTLAMIFTERAVVFNYYTSFINVLVAGSIAFVSAYSYWKMRYDSFLDKEELKKLVAYDVLTNVLNRRGFDTVFSHSWSEAVREKSQLALFIIDIDHFKRYNDTYGHVEGDMCLAAIAETLACSIRENDFVARYGGEEFAIVMSRADIATAEVVADRIFANIKTKNIHHKDSVAPYVTVSIGCMIAFPTTEGIKQGEFVVMADQALYMAKAAGRNRFVIHPNGREVAHGKTKGSFSFAKDNNGLAGEAVKV